MSWCIVSDLDGLAGGFMVFAVGLGLGCFYWLMHQSGVWSATNSSVVSL